MRKISSRSSLLIGFLPTHTRCRESQLQYGLNPARCQPMTVSGCTRISTRFHPGQSRRNITLNNLSATANRGCGCLTFNAPSCCRKAIFSNRRSRRKQADRTSRTNKSFTQRSIQPVLHGDMPERVHPPYLQARTSAMRGRNREEWQPHNSPTIRIPRSSSPLLINTLRF